MWNALIFLACASDPPGQPVDDAVDLADVVQVSTSGETGAYTLAVTLSSPDTGCERYADWWEVVDDQGQLVFRRILNHSHPDEQPFTRSGGPMDARADQVLTVRAHMHPDGYGGQAVRGVPSVGFEVVELAEGWGADLARIEPQPEGCWY